MVVEIFGDGKSVARNLVEPASFWLMTQVHHAVPQLTPDQVTIYSALFNTVLTAVQQQAHIAEYKFSPTELKVLGLLKILAYYGDKGDGSLADVYDVEEPGKHDRLNGQKLDPKWDRRQEAWAALLRARTAYIKGDLFGEMAADAAAISCMMPSTERARLETTGFKPQEFGKNPLEFWGARTGRCILSEMAGWRVIGGRNIQPWADLTATAANLYTAYTRRQLYEEYKDVVFPPLTGKDAEKRQQTIEFAKVRLCDLERIQHEIISMTVAEFIALRTLPIELVRLKP